MSAFGLGSYLPSPLGPNRQIGVVVLDNAVAVANGDELHSFADVDAALTFLRESIVSRRKALDVYRFSTKTQRGPGANAAELTAMIESIAGALGLPLDTIRAKIKEQFGIEPWQDNESDPEVD